MSPARGDLCAHFLGSLPDSSPRALGLPKGMSTPPHLAGRGCEVKFPSPFPVRVGSPFLAACVRIGAPRSGCSRGRRSVPFGGPLAPRVGAKRGPPASSRRCVRPLLAAAGRAGLREWQVLLPGSPLLGPRVCESLGWMALSSLTFRTALHQPFCRVLLPSSPRCFISSPPTLHSALAPRVALTPGHFQAFSPAARAQVSLFLPRRCVNMDTPPPSLRYRGAQPPPPAALFLSRE